MSQCMCSSTNSFSSTCFSQFKAVPTPILTTVNFVQPQLVSHNHTFQGKMCPHISNNFPVSPIMSWTILKSAKTLMQQCIIEYPIYIIEIKPSRAYITVKWYCVTNKSDVMEKPISSTLYLPGSVSLSARLSQSICRLSQPLSARLSQPLLCSVLQCRVMDGGHLPNHLQLDETLLSI